nr:YlxR family protein [Murinocardiopsis flavida]
MCVGCRSRAAQDDLLRLVAEGGVLLPDSARRMPGRGAYLHRDPRCWAQAERRRVWRRALRADGAIDTSRVGALFADAPCVGVGPGSG